MKTVIITGAGGRLGISFIKALIDKGYNISACELDAKRVSETKKLFKGKNFYISKCDITIEDDLESFFKETIDIFGQIDAIVNNASITSELLEKYGEPPSSFENTTLKSWNHTLAVNLTAPFTISKIFTKYFKECGHPGVGKIINVSSIYALNAPDPKLYENSKIKSFAAYSASKAGLIGLTLWMSSFLAKNNITVNAIAPGGVFNNHTKEFKSKLEEKIPLGRMAEPEDISNVLEFLISDKSNYINGQVINVDGGFSSR